MMENQAQGAGRGDCLPRAQGGRQGGRVKPPSSILHPPSCKGLSLIELAVVICIVMVLMSAFLNRMFYYQEQAEKAAMEGVAASIQSALTMRYGLILLHGQPSDVPALAHDNPLNWLQRKPPNYAGEYYDPTPQAVTPGNWLFDLKTRELIYVPNAASHFTPDKRGQKWARFHVAVASESLQLPSMQSAPASLVSALFEPVAPYTWF